MKKILLLIIVFIGFIVVYRKYNKSHRNIAKEKTDFIISANDLYDAFENNENISNKMYLDKVIEVSGNIIEIDQDQNKNTVLTLEAKNSMIGGALCTLNSNDKIELNTNIVLKCRCTGFLMDVILKDCTIKNDK